MRHQNRKAILLVALVMLLTVTGAAQAKIQLTFWHWSGADDIKATVQAFNESQDEIEVVFVPTGSYIDRLTMGFVANEGPDLFALEVWPHRDMPVIAWLEGGLIYDVSRLWERDKHEVDGSSWFPFIVQSVTHGGKMAGLPHGWQPYSVLEYNIDIFESMGVQVPDNTWTWVEFGDVARKMGRVSATGEVEQWGIQPNSIWFWFVAQNMIDSAGGTIFNENQTAIEFSPEALRALNQLFDLKESGAALPGGGSWGTWYEGRVAMRIAALNWSTASYHHLNNNTSNPFRPGIEVGPKDPLTGLNRAALGVQAIAINAQTQYPEAAWEFLKFYAKNAAAVQLRALGLVRDIPVTPQGVELFFSQDPNTIGPEFAANLPRVTLEMADNIYFRPEPVNPVLATDKAARIQVLLQDELWKVMFEDMPPYQFFENARTLVDPILQGRD